jgi:hypothetical protein
LAIKKQKKRRTRLYQVVSRAGASLGRDPIVGSTVNFLFLLPHHVLLFFRAQPSWREPLVMTPVVAFVHSTMGLHLRFNFPLLPICLTSQKWKVIKKQKDNYKKEKGQQ